MCEFALSPLILFSLFDAGPTVGQGATMDSVFKIFDKAFDACQSFGVEEWAVISVTAVIFGYFCLRGMSIR